MSDQVVLWGFRIGAPILAGAVGGVAVGMVGSDLVTGTLDSLSTTLKQNQILTGIVGGIAIAIAVGVVINFDSAKKLVGVGGSA